MADWQNRIIGLEHIPANQLMAHPHNARRHPGKQREALRGSLDTLGWYDAVIYNKRTGYLIDGHARVEEQLTKDEHATIPALVVDLTEAEEAQALASHDWITQLAEYDRATLDELLRQTNSDDARVQAMLSEMAEVQGIILPDETAWDSAFNSLPDEDRAPFQQMTFTLHDQQVDIVRDAIRQANDAGEYDSLNDNSNGNAITRICEAYLNGQS